MPQITREVLKTRSEKSEVNTEIRSQKSRKRRRIIGCGFLFATQIILLSIWGAFFFILGTIVDKTRLPEEVLKLISAISEFLRYLGVL
jgi:hypothetical protein